MKVPLGALYQYRLHQLARQSQMTLGTRVEERMPVARDLHDTLLQSFHGVLIFPIRYVSIRPIGWYAGFLKIW